MLKHTFDLYSLHCFKRHKIMTKLTILEFYVSVFPTVGLFSVVAAQCVVSGLETASLYVVAVVVVLLSVSTWTKLPVY